MEKTTLGKKGEELVRELCKTEKLAMQDFSTRWERKGFDFLINGNRVEVTSAKLSSRNKWYFLTTTNSRSPKTYDFLITIGFCQENISFILVIPSSEIKTYFISLTPNKQTASWKQYSQYLLTGKLRAKISAKLINIPKNE